MKKLFMLLFLCSLAYAMQAQHYRPLHDSVYLQFQLTTPPEGSEPTFSHLYPTFSEVSGNDSIYNISCSPNHPTADWPLGYHFIKYDQPHRYAFVSNFQDTCKIQTDYDLGVSWQYYTDAFYPDITARFVAKQLYTFGGVTDSVLVIKLSTGDTIRISKHYGICNFRSLFNFHPGDPFHGGLDTLALVSMSSTPVQQPIYKPQEVFNYLPGETFYYKDGNFSRTWNPPFGYTVTTTWTTFKLIVTNATSIADTTYYDFNWFEGQQFQNGPYTFRLKVTTEDVTLVSGNTFFPELDIMFSPTQCGINFSDLTGAVMSIYKGHDQSQDDDYLYWWGDEQGQLKSYWYDTDNGYFQFKYRIMQDLYHVTELVARFAPGTPDTDNLYLTGNYDQMASKALRVFPIPCTDQLTIEGTTLKNMKIEITTVSGANIPSSQYSVSENTVSTGNLKSGVYILYLKNDSNVLTKMFVKE